VLAVYCYYTSIIAAAAKVVAKIKVAA